LRKQAEQLFYDYKVNPAITGHVHAYERTFPLYNDAATQLNYDSPQAPVYILQGGSGNREGNDGFPSELPAWSAGHESAVGYGLMTVYPDSIAFSYYASQSQTNGGPILKDSFSMSLWK